MYSIFLVAVFICLTNQLFAQNSQLEDLEQLKKEVLALRTDVATIRLNLETSKTKFQRGIAVATIGYTVTIAGGLMLGRKNDELGKVLLIAGGATGVTGTVLMVDAFRHLTGKTRRR